MAAPRSRLQEADSDSSSSSEDLERFREAAWEPPGSVKKTVQCKENTTSPVVPSLRVRPDRHEHDGNELQTTPEFRTHVAKKLAAMLDTCITEIPGSNRFHQASTAASDSEDEGFRLLTTSVPGDSGKIPPSPTLKRKVASSTSEESEEEKQRRCREAAVSGLDILRHSALHTAPVEIMDTASKSQPKKKKKKKKAKKERVLSDETETDDEKMEPKGNINGLKKKKKERGICDDTQSDDQTIHPESKKESKKNKTESDGQSINSETVKDGSKKKKTEMGLIDETATDQYINPICGKSGTKKKKKKLGENCHEHD